MAETIIRIYETEAQGAKAVAQLRDAGFQDVFHFKSSGAKGAAAAKARAALVDEIAASHIWKSHAESYAAQLDKGGSMVKVSAPFSSGKAAAHILDSHSPSHKGFSAEIKSRAQAWDDAAPLSSALQIPVLTNIKLPIETLTGASSLSKGKAFISSLLGMPLLSRGLEHATSSWGMPLLSRSVHHKTSSWGLPLLSRSSTPLSSMFGLRVLK
jgi:hypothetical protein